MPHLTNEKIGFTNKFSIKRYAESKSYNIFQHITQLAGPFEFTVE